MTSSCSLMSNTDIHWPRQRFWWKLSHCGFLEMTKIWTSPRAWRTPLNNVWYTKEKLRNDRGKTEESLWPIGDWSWLWCGEFIISHWPCHKIGYVSWVKSTLERVIFIPKHRLQLYWRWKGKSILHHDRQNILQWKKRWICEWNYRDKWLR